MLDVTASNSKASWRAHVTQHGQLKGKPGYMAPEQLARESVDRRTDVFAAGIVLFELLTGTRLFRDQAMRYRPPSSGERAMPAPSTFVPELPHGLDELVLTALSVDRKNRFQDARRMADALMDAASPARELEGSVEASPSGYAVGQSNLSRAERAEAQAFHGRIISATQVATVVVTAALGLIGRSYVARPGRPTARPSSEGARSHIPEPATSPAGAVFVASEPTSDLRMAGGSADAPSSMPSSISAPAPFHHSRGVPALGAPRAAAPGGSMRLNGRRLNAETPAYDPLLDDRRH